MINEALMIMTLNDDHPVNWPALMRLRLSLSLSLSVSLCVYVSESCQFSRRVVRDARLCPFLVSCSLVFSHSMTDCPDAEAARSLSPPCCPSLSPTLILLLSPFQIGAAAAAVLN